MNKVLHVMCITNDMFIEVSHNIMLDIPGFRRSILWVRLKDIVSYERTCDAVQNEMSYFNRLSQ